MSIVYRCPECGKEHRSRLHASRPSYFQDVVSQVGEVLERCPSTGDWTRVTFTDLSWKPRIEVALRTS